MWPYELKVTRSLLLGLLVHGGGHGGKEAEDSRAGGYIGGTCYPLGRMDSRLVSFPNNPVRGSLVAFADAVVGEIAGC